MPPHHHYADWEWEDLPESALTAAKLIGYTKELWDEGAQEKTSYWKKPIEDLSDDEKRAATYLGYDILEHRLDGVKFNVISPKAQKYAKIMGWTEETWNDNWAIHDMDCNEYYWDEMSPELREACEYYGWNKNLWDELGEEEVFDGKSSAKPSKNKPNRKQNAAEEKKDDNDDKSSNNNNNNNDNKKKPAKFQVPPGKFSQSETFGGNGLLATKFDHGNHPHIDSISINADANRVHGMIIKYNNCTETVGTISDKTNNKTMKFRPGEHITRIVVRVHHHHVVAMTFHSNRGTQLVGGTSKSGWEKSVEAPTGTVLCGLTGSAGRHVNSIGFRWGPQPIKKN